MNSDRIAWLCTTVAVLAAAQGLTGVLWPASGTPWLFDTMRHQTAEIYGRGLYRYDTTFIAAGSQGTDVITIFVAVALVVITHITTHETVRKQLLQLGATVYTSYVMLSLGIGAAYNEMFLLYVVGFITSMFATANIWIGLDGCRLAAAYSHRFPRRTAATFLILSGVATALLWGSDIVISLAKSQPPVLLGPYTTIITYFIDLAIIVPLCLVAASLLLRRHPHGISLALALLMLLSLIMGAVGSQTAFQWSARAIHQLDEVAGVVIAWFALGGSAIVITAKCLRSLSFRSR